MNRTSLALAATLAMMACAQAQNTFDTPQTPTGGPRAAGVQIMCKNSSGFSVPCGDSTNPLQVSGGGGGSSSFPANLTPTDCSGTITTGGTAQNAIAAQTTLHGFQIGNIDATTGSGEPLWISFTGTAAAATAGSYPISAPTSSTTYIGMGSYTTPPGFGTNHAVSIVGATTGHKFSCTWW